jgi:hypothetical protein
MSARHCTKRLSTVSVAGRQIASPATSTARCFTTYESERNASSVRRQHSGSKRTQNIVATAGPIRRAASTATAASSLPESVKNAIEVSTEYGYPGSHEDYH